MTNRKNKKIEKKDKVVKKPVLSDEERLKRSRAIRLQMAGMTTKDVELKSTRAEFRKYFIQIKQKLGLKSSLEEVMWLHFKASGFDQKDKFDDGVRHFGYRL